MGPYSLARVIIFSSNAFNSVCFIFHPPTIAWLWRSSLDGLISTLPSNPSHAQSCIVGIGYFLCQSPAHGSCDCGSYGRLGSVCNTCRIYLPRSLAPLPVVCKSSRWYSYSYSPFDCWFLCEVAYWFAILLFQGFHCIIHRERRV